MSNFPVLPPIYGEFMHKAIIRKIQLQVNHLHAVRVEMPSHKASLTPKVINSAKKSPQDLSITNKSSTEG